MNGANDYRGEPAGVDDIVAQFNFLADVDHKELEQLFQNSAFVQDFSQGELLYDQDTPVEKVYILLTGRGEQVRVEFAEDDGRVTRTLARTVESGALLGLYDFLFAEEFNNQYRTSAKALEACTVLSIDATALNRLLYRFPEMRRDLAPMQLINRLQTIPLVGGSDMMALGFLADATEQRAYEPDVMVYQPGDEEENIFLIDRGQTKLDWGDHVRWLGNGAAFSPEMSSNTDDFSSASHSAKVTTPSDLLAIPIEKFRAIVGWDPLAKAIKKSDAREHALQDLFDELFEERDFSIEQRNLLSGFMSHYYFPTNSVLIQQGEEANSLWVLMKGGQAALHALDEDGAKLQTTISVGPTYFAETALQGQVPQDSTVEALAGSEWLRLYWRDFQDYDEAEPVDMRSLLLIEAQEGEVVTSGEQRKKFPWLQRGELIVLFSRRHWIAYLRKGVPSFIAFAILMGLTLFGSLIPGLQWWIAIPFGIAALAALLLFIWGTIDYFNDWVVVTNRRVVHQEKVLFINEWRKEAPLEQIQNVNFQTTFIGRWFNYGTMVIQTASTSGVIAFEYTTHFDRLYDAIMEQRRRRRRHTVAQSKLAIHQMLGKRLGLNLALPKQVYRGGRLRKVETGWRRRTAGRVMPSLRMEAGSRIIWRRHWMVLLPRLWWALLILAFWIVILVLSSALSFGEQIPEGWQFVVFAVQAVAVISLLVAAARVAWVVANWRNDTYEVGDEALLHVEKLPFAIAEDRKSASLGNIQNVEMYINSPIQWIFNYGDVVCQTAAEEGDFRFAGVPDPRSVADEILRRIERFRRLQDEISARKRAQDLPDWFEIYNTLELEGLGEKPFR